MVSFYSIDDPDFDFDIDSSSDYNSEIDSD